MPFCVCGNGKNPSRLECTLLFGLTSHLVYTGYVVLGLWLLALLVAFFQKRKNKWPVLGFAELLVAYVIVNWSLILEILVGDSSYVSHREEMVSSAAPFFETFGASSGTAHNTHRPYINI